ncbi:putative NAD-dependent malic enzyme 2 [Psilocybe cubensis]|uniref:NAD-dependent malic enzyme 2 n=1 Tax=Psilocybe cubensis TaxID=181762 RepID=A0ACB8HDD4_PSICU|nr:putative NAD-dependent malic enzyme 2 [Psilocybe cubensis]KAH9486018.1 putative NAD-dependent malic enzyme 2 [Psilocybe cubensis]
MAALNVHKPANLIPALRIALRGHALLENPRFNKGTGFTLKERKTFGLEGRLPYRTNSLDEQCERAYAQLNQRDTPIRKNTFLQSLKDQNWVLYYSLLARHLKELIPIIYTPTEAEAIASYSHVFRRSDGLFLSYPDEDIMEEMFLEQTRGRDIELIVVTDAEAILGIDASSLIGGIDPSKSLSVTLDVGTNNEDLLNDPLYVGWPERRIRGEDYDRFVDKFVQLVRKYHPHCLLHFEDFGVTNAHRILDRYRDTHAVFNDDIQGTGAVTLACIMSAIRVSSRGRESASSPTKKKLSDQRYILFGAGSAGMGIAVQLRDAIVSADGLSRAEANRLFWMIDRVGLLHENLRDQSVTEHTREFVRPADEGWGEDEEHVSLLQVVKKVRPTVLIGCSTSAGAFSKEVVEAMMDGLDEGAHPIILPLSNPSRLAEAVPKDLMHWTNGRALIATGSPFESVKMKVDGKDMEFFIAECNNALIYPGLGFGSILSNSRKVTDTMLIAGAKRLAALSPAISSTDDGEYNGASLLPDFGDSPQVNFEVGVTVAEQAVREGTSTADWSGSTDEEREKAVQEVRRRAEKMVWVPIYPEYIYDPSGLNDA